MLTVWWLKFYNKKSYGSQVKIKSVYRKSTALLTNSVTMHTDCIVMKLITVAFTSITLIIVIITQSRYYFILYDQ